MKEAIRHNLEVAKPIFINFISSIDASMSKWIQYRGVKNDNGRIVFKFKSSQNSLSFEVYGGVSTMGVFELLQASSNEIYDYFRDLKYDQLNYNR